MISTRYYDNRFKDILQTLQTRKKRSGTSASAATLPTSTQAVLNRWMRSVYLCRSNEPGMC
jgi:hypothetical protein